MIRRRMGVQVLLWATGLALTGVVAAQQPSAANPEVPEEEGARTARIEEIVVTARRKEESLQDVPTAVTAIDAQTLEDLQISNFGEVGQTVPNLNIQRQFGSASSPQIYMRGVSTGSLKFQTDAGIGLYVDGVYLGRPAATAFDIADIERVEVLRGPQGTLFGRNSTGGAINFITRPPSGEFRIKGELGAGNYGARRGRLSADFPEVGGFSTRLTYLHDEHEGYVDRVGPASTYNFAAPFGQLRSAADFGNEETNSIGLAVRYAGIEGLTADYRLDYTEKDSSQLAPQMLAQYGSFNPSFTLRPPVAVTVNSAERADALALDTSQTDLTVEGHSLTVEYAVTDTMRVKNIASYRRFTEGANFNDIDGNRLADTGILSVFLGIPGPPFLIGGSGAPLSWISSGQLRGQHQVSDELQLIGEGEHFDWIAGAFWFRERGYDNNPVFLFTAFPPNATYVPGVTNGSILGQRDYFAGFNGTVENKSVAGYVHGTWRITDAWDLSAGLRYTDDQREENIIEVAAIRNRSFDLSDSHTDWDASLTYKFAGNTSAYVKASTGYLSGGVIGGLAFAPETISSYELGLKSDLFDQRLRLNVAAFRAERDDLQVLSFSPQRGTFLANGGSRTQKGVELEVTAVPLDGLTLTANYGRVDFGTSGNTRVLAPESNAYVSGEYDFRPFANGSYLGFRVDAGWQDEHFGLQCPLGATQDPALGCTNLQNVNRSVDAALVQDATTLVGARLSLFDIGVGNGKAKVSLWGRNLLDEDEPEFLRDLGNGTVIGSFMVPRTYGVDFSIDF